MASVRADPDRSAAGRPGPRTLLRRGAPPAAGAAVLSVDQTGSGRVVRGRPRAPGRTAAVVRFRFTPAPAGAARRRRPPRNRSPRSARRAPIVRMVKPSGRSAGSSSSSQSIGADTGAPAAGRGLYGRDQRLVDRVLGVVQAGEPAAVVDLPLPAHQLRHDRADGSGQLLDPGPGVVEGRPGGDRHPDLDAAPAGHLRARPRRRGARARCGAAGPGRAGRPTRSSCPGRGRSARSWAGAARRPGEVQGCHSSAPKFAAHTSAAGSSTTR